jgi:hypothetical protein
MTVESGNKACALAPAERQGLGQDRPRRGNTGALTTAFLTGGL